MQQSESDATDRMVKNERRGVWLALVVILALALTLVIGSDTRRALLTGMVVAIVFAVTWLGQCSSGKSRSDIRKSRDAVMHDELRHAALASAYKWAFFAILGTLATFCVLSTVLTFGMSTQMLAALTVALGASVFLILFLLKDRA